MLYRWDEILFCKHGHSPCVLRGKAAGFSINKNRCFVLIGCSRYSLEEGKWAGYVSLNDPQLVRRNLSVPPWGIALACHDQTMFSLVSDWLHATVDSLNSQLTKESGRPPAVKQKVLQKPWGSLAKFIPTRTVIYKIVLNIFSSCFSKWMLPRTWQQNHKK